MRNIVAMVAIAFAGAVSGPGYANAQSFNFQDVDQLVEQLCSQNGIDCTGNQSASNVASVTQSSGD